MRYDEIYRQAMDKVKASDSWKADTLAKMAAAAPQKPRLTVWRRALPAAAAAAVCLTAVLSLSLAGGPSAAPLADSAAESSSSALAAQPAPAAIAPRTAEKNSRMAPALLLEDAEEVPVPQEAAALLQQEQLPEALPVWRGKGEEAVLEGEYPLVSAEQALTQAGLDAAADTQLVYVASGGYTLPAWKLETAGETVYLPAVAGQ